jgi:two-component sensor histidine kinase
MQLKFFLITIFTISSCAGFSQSLVSDSLYNHALTLEKDSARIDYLINSIWKYRSLDRDVSFDLLGKLDEFQESTKSDYKKDTKFYYYGILYKNVGQYDKSEEYLDRYYEVQKEKGDIRRMGIAVQAKCNMFFEQGLYDKSMEAGKQAIEILEQLDNKKVVIPSYSRVGGILMELGRYDDAMEYHQLALRKALAAQDTFYLGNVMNDIGILFEKKGNLDSTLFYYNKYRELSAAMGNKDRLVYAYYNLGTVYEKMGELNKAKVSTQKSLDLAREVNDPVMEIYARLGLGSQEIQSGSISKGIKLIEPLQEEQLTLEQQMSIAEILYKAYKDMGRNDDALSHHEKFKLVSDSILNQDITRQVSELEMAFETNKKNQEIERLSLEDQIKSSRLSSQKKWIGGLIFGLATLAFLLYRLFRQKQQINEQNERIIKTLDEKELLLKEIHHRVKNNLQLISSLLSLQSRSIEDDVARQAIDEGQARVRSMALIHQDLYNKDNLTAVNTREYLSKLTQELAYTFGVSSNIEIQLNVDDMLIDVSTIVPVGLIINELVTNSMKYAFPDQSSGKITISLSESDQKLNLMVKDNGIGYNPDSKRTGSFGLTLIKALTKQLDGDMEMKFDPGTEINITFKKYKVAA